MWPRTARGEKKQRAHKRSKEGRVLLEMLRDELTAVGKGCNGRILEFGAGAGYQASWLCELGDLVVSDIYIDPELTLPRDVPFVLCDIAHAPFESERFDLVFSNHVIEHLADYDNSFKELQRIGRPDCLYAFAVPTALWVLLSVPVQYRDKAGNIWSRVCHKLRDATESEAGAFAERVDHSDYNGGSLMAKVLPHGHGRFGRFRDALDQFRASSWRELFGGHGFDLVRDRAVLCYGPAGWPVVPPNRALTRFGMCSSRVFFLRKKQ